MIPLSSKDEDAVRLMTAHAAKGLEFPTSSSFAPIRVLFRRLTRSRCIEFPRELHDPGSIAQDDDKELCQQEERRLFYVAMTRARDSLTIYAKQGTGQRSQPCRLPA